MLYADVSWTSFAVSGMLRKQCSKEFHNVYSSPLLFACSSQRMSWMKEMRTPYYILNGKPEMERPCERHIIEATIILKLRDFRLLL